MLNNRPGTHSWSGRVCHCCQHSCQDIGLSLCHFASSAPKDQCHDCLRMSFRQTMRKKDLQQPENPCVYHPKLGCPLQDHTGWARLARSVALRNGTGIRHAGGRCLPQTVYAWAVPTTQPERVMTCPKVFVDCLRDAPTHSTHLWQLLPCSLHRHVCVLLHQLCAGVQDDVQERSSRDLHGAGGEPPAPRRRWHAG